MVPRSARKLRYCSHCQGVRKVSSLMLRLSSQEKVWRQVFLVQLFSLSVQCLPMVQRMPTVERPFVFVHWVRGGLVKYDTFLQVD